VVQSPENASPDDAGRPRSAARVGACEHVHERAIDAVRRATDTSLLEKAIGREPIEIASGDEPSHAEQIVLRRDGVLHGRSVFRFLQPERSDQDALIRDRAAVPFSSAKRRVAATSMPRARVSSEPRDSRVVRAVCEFVQQIDDER
jgi:hypothetical protein